MKADDIDSILANARKAAEKEVQRLEGDLASARAKLSGIVALLGQQPVVQQTTTTKRVSTASLIREHVKSHPGCTRNEIADALESQITTKSDAAKTVIMAAISGLKIKSRELEERDGKFYSKK